MPIRVTIFRWLEKYPDFESNFLRARRLQADYMDDLVQDTADNSTPLTANSDRVKIMAYQWRAERLNCRKFGPPPSRQQISGPDGGPVRQITSGMTAQEAVEAYQAMLRTEQPVMIEDQRGE
jgi:hypothetical protein